MDNRELIEDIRAAVKAVRDKGEAVIDTVALDAYLAQLANTVAVENSDAERAHKTELADLSASHEANLAHYNATNERWVEMARAMTTFSNTALKTSLLVCGGSAVAVLGFLSNAWAKDVPATLRVDLAESLLCFAGGVLAAAVATGVTVLSQGAFMLQGERRGQAFRVVVIVLVAISYALFGLGAWAAYRGFVGNGA